MLQAALTIVLTACMLGSAAAAGIPVLRIFVPEDGSDEAFSLHALCMGWLFLALGTLALGLAGALKPWTLAALWIAPAVLWGRPAAGYIRNDMRRLVHWWRRAPWLSRAFAVAVASAATLNLLACMAPQTSADALRYHLAVPRIHLELGANRYLPWHFQSELPYNFDMLFTAGLAFGGAPLATCLHWAAGIACALAAASFTARRLTGTDPALVAAIFYTAPLVAWESNSAFIDLGPAMGMTLAFSAMYKALARPEARGWLMVAGLEAGFAIGCKPTSAVVALAMAPLALYHASRLGWRRIFAAACAALASTSPWFLKAWWRTGNPVFPQLHGIFGGSYWNSDLARHTRDLFRVAGDDRSLTGYMTLPWRFMTQGSTFDGSERIGAAFLVLAPLALAAFWRDRRLTPVALVFALSLGMLATMPQYSRYAIPALPFGAMLLAAGVCVWKDAWLIRSGLSVAALCLAINLAGTVLYDAQFLKVGLGLANQDAFIAAKTRYYPAIARANRELPAGSKLLVMTTFGYYFDHTYVRGIPTKQAWIDYRQYADGDALARRLRDEGMTHLFHVQPPAGPSWNSEELFAEMVASGRLVEVFLQEVQYSASRTLGGPETVETVTVYRLVTDDL